MAHRLSARWLDDAGAIARESMGVGGDPQPARGPPVSIDLPEEPAEIEHDIGPALDYMQFLALAYQHKQYKEYIEPERQELIDGALWLIASLRSGEPSPIAHLQHRRAALRSVPL
jgi:hypothetical protein